MDVTLDLLRAENERLRRRVAELEQAEAQHRQTVLSTRPIHEQFIWEGMTDAVVVSDPQGTILAANSAFCKLYNISLHELIGQPYSSILPYNDPETALARYKELFANPDASSNVVQTFRHRNGRLMTIESRIGFIIDNGDRIAMYSIIRDITAQRQIEEELHRSQALLHAFLDYSPAIIDVRDRRGNHVLFSRRAAELLNLNPEQLVDSEYVVNFADDFMAAWHAYDQAVLHTGTIVQVEEHVKVNSEQRSFALTIFPVYDTQGRISHIGSIATDITELLQVEAAYRSLVEQSLQGLVILQDERVVFANEAVVTMTGHSMSELFACTIDTFSSDVHPDDLEMLYEHYQDVLHQRSPPEKNTVRHIRYRFRRADGELRWFESAATPIIYRGNDALQIASLDVTERKSIEDAMHAERATLQRQVEVQTADLRHTNTALRRAMRVKDEFLAMMSHELRTPLNTILGMTEALRDEVYGKLNERQQHGLQMIETSGQNLLALINDILDVTRIEAGQVQLNLQEVLIHEVCRSALRMVESAARHKQIDVSFEIAPSARVIRADVSRLKQILINLLSNAVKFTPEKGRIGLDISGDMPQQCISFVVWDTGIGIPPDRMDQLFKPFVQIDSSLSRNFEGTGLGLTLVRSLIELHGGSVSVESTPGSGSRFTVTLPMYANTQHVVHPDTQTSLVVANGSKNNAGATDDPRPHILLVEDNPSNSRIIEDYLNIYGYRVSTVTNGMAALTSITTLTPRLVLLDIQIPDIDGLEVLRRIRTDSRVASLPIIALTAHGLPDDHERLLAAGATASLSKPISLKQMMHAIASNLS